jgi:hypothetical protein
MEENLATDNSAVAVADNPQGEPDNASNETGASGGQAQGATPTDDLFKGVDPNRLPPELKKSYNDMLTDYREKTSKLSETIKSESQKAAEAYKSKAELYDQVAAQEEFVRQWNEYVQKAQNQSEGKDPSGDPVLSQMKQQIQEMNQKIQLSELSQVTESFAEAVNEKGERLHPDFDQLNEFVIGKMPNGKDGDQYSLLRACVELSSGRSPQEKLSNGYKAAKEVHDRIFEAGKKAGMGRLQAKVLNGTNPPLGSSSDVLSVTDKKPKNAHEAFAMAKRGQVVSRD